MPIANKPGGHEFARRYSGRRKVKPPLPTFTAWKKSEAGESCSTPYVTLLAAWFHHLPLSLQRGWNCTSVSFHRNHSSNRNKNFSSVPSRKSSLISSASCARVPSPWLNVNKPWTAWQVENHLASMVCPRDFTNVSGRCLAKTMWRS